MTEPAAFRAVYADWKLIKTRSTVQVVLEIPVEHADAAYEVLGGMPVAGKERWFAVAALKDQQSSPSAVAKPDPVSTAPAGSGKRDWRDLPPAQQAALRGNSATFVAFLKEEHPEDWRESNGDAAECIRLVCAVESRSQFNIEHAARMMWKQLDDQFQAWERVGV